MAEESEALLLPWFSQVLDLRLLQQLALANGLLGAGLHKEFFDLVVILPCPAAWIRALKMDYNC